jgi:RimJ/RimL family protein N-acetyltransferase
MRRTRIIRLPSGAQLLARPLEPGDRALLAGFMERLGEDSRYQRFLAHRDSFTERELDYLTELDHHDHEAIVAIDPATSEAVGVARYIRTGPRIAEIAVTVADDWQGRGVGARLLRLLARRARREGVHTFVGLTLAGNDPALRLLSGLGGARRSRAGTHMRISADLPRPWKPRRRRRRRRRPV